MSPFLDPDVVAKSAYHAYGEVTDFKNFRGEPMPVWEALPEPIRRAWRASVGRVVWHVEQARLQEQRRNR